MIGNDDLFVGNAVDDSHARGPRPHFARVPSISVKGSFFFFFFSLVAHLTRDGRL